jgi:hypothetical protein
MLGPVAVAFAPAALRRRVVRPVPAGLRFHLGTAHRSALVITALMVGAVTHVLWDSFTHAGMWGPRHIPWLAETHGPLPGYEWAQYASDVAGALVIVWWCVRWWRLHPRSHTETDATATQQPAPTRRAVLAAWILVGISTVFGTANGLLVGSGTDDPIRSALFLGATRGTSAGTAMATLLAGIWTLRRLTVDREARSGRTQAPA